MIIDDGFISTVLRAAGLLQHVTMDFQILDILLPVFFPWNCHHPRPPFACIVNTEHVNFHTDFVISNAKYTGGAAAWHYSLTETPNHFENSSSNYLNFYFSFFCDVGEKMPGLFVYIIISWMTETLGGLAGLGLGLRQLNWDVFCYWCRFIETFSLVVQLFPFLWPKQCYLCWYVNSKQSTQKFKLIWSQRK